ncbi:MAG: protein phosphatase 2C domain-containing protein [Zoogloeaceae bacterium]|jgi:serine/threonine protein phosphatase PrpC|nr:protein phosphatase 2C domain-containing protein [Zoogloeaceae bacterium]
MNLKLDACIAQHQGDRKEQQDRLTLVAHQRVPGVMLAVVADGMGGHTGGALAAEQVIHTLSANFQQWGNEEDPRLFVAESLNEVHTMIKASRFINEKDPHSTAVLLMLCPHNTVLWAHCGDSRLYAFRGLHLRVRTTDHSYVEHLIQTGKITPEEAETHPNRNILLTSLGGQETPKVDFGSLEDVQAGDSFLLCSDGLWGYFDDYELGAIMATGSVREAASQLIRLARARGEGKGDNVSVAILKFS